MKLNISLRLVTPILITAVLTGCTRTIVEAYDRPSETAISQAYVKRGADFSQYQSLMTDGLEIYYPEDGEPPAQEDLDRIRSIFREAFVAAIGDDYPIVSEPGPDVLKVNSQLVDMKVIGRGGDYAPGGRLRDLVARGELTFLMEIADSRTGEVLARAGDRSKDVSVADEAAEWDEVEAAAQYWAGLFRAWLDRSLGH